ncbi:MAG: glycosyltransferase family 2 protein [Bacilli bacterium]|nr:glycosyltransferase family 2 protein [Bacilli bacterium]
MNESVDILIPVYNGAKYIKRCLDSILSQTYENINIVVLNDGSIDESLNIF